MKLSNPILVAILILQYASADYWSDRNVILAQEVSKIVGSSIQLSEKEQTVNDILMGLKIKEYEDGFHDPSTFLPSIHFFKSKAAIEKSEVFKFIQKLPKGASLHSHSSAMVSFDYLYNLTYYNNLYGCDKDGTFKLHFFFNSTDNDCQWKLLSDWRQEDSNFDNFLKSKLTLVVDDPTTTYSSINDVWSKFDSIFSLISPMFDYRPLLRDYLLQVLQEFHDDNVMYLEIRGSFGETFDSDGTVYNRSQTLKLYLDTMMEFREKNPDFQGFRVIYARSRKVNNETMEKYIKQYFELKNEYPELIAGFDLVGQEDKGEPLSLFADQLVQIANKTNFFFHAGETNWYGKTDLNLIDAVLLNTSRIGHAFALTKHPEVLKIVKDKQIAIELNPLSNQVLKLVDDLRNHVGATLISQGYPVVITCDDPSFWGAKGLSYDWYMAFMAMTPRDGDLRILKQLALNSIIYSSLDEEQKPYVLALFEDKWDRFLNAILE